MSKLPWRAFNASGVVCVTDSEPITEAYLDGTARPFLLVCHGATEEEAYLIAAAPDLLEALELLMANTDGTYDSAQWLKGKEMARAAIAKAKGESE